MPPNIILASTSRYRARLLSRLKLPFSTLDPGVDEAAFRPEHATARASRLARAKAVSGALAHRNSKPEEKHKAVIIGTDQVAHLGRKIFSKPGNFAQAFEQLRASSGKWVTFSVGLSLCNQAGAVIAEGLDQYAIRYRDLADHQIEHYLNQDKPYDCAGSIKAESLGVALFTETRGKDINTLYGLPLILLVNLLDAVGISTL